MAYWRVHIVRQMEKGCAISVLCILPLYHGVKPLPLMSLVLSPQERELGRPRQGEALCPECGNTLDMERRMGGAPSKCGEGDVFWL